MFQRAYKYHKDIDRINQESYNIKKNLEKAGGH